jgi:hypothetical protein
MRLGSPAPTGSKGFFLGAFAQPDATTMQYNQPFSIFENARMVD